MQGFYSGRSDPFGKDRGLDFLFLRSWRSPKVMACRYTWCAYSSTRGLDDARSSGSRQAVSCLLPRAYQPDLKWRIMA